MWIYFIRQSRHKHGRTLRNELSIKLRELIPITIRFLEQVTETKPPHVNNLLRGNLHTISIGVR